MPNENIFLFLQKVKRNESTRKGKQIIKIERKEATRLLLQK